MKIAVVLVSLILCVAAVAMDIDERKIYLEFESDYHSNNAENIDAWLAQDVSLKQTLHIPGIGADTIKVTREQILSSMRKTNRPNTTPMSNLDDVTIEKFDDGRFCGNSKTVTETVVTGKKYIEKEDRKVCFRLSQEKYLVTEQTIDVYYTEK